ncbi:MAG: hypothetical protein IPK80_07580 [Nannocystis sp.]|nr:hypothetical protein [Nannocystis sp.]
MFGMGLLEILMVGIVVLLLFSPKELPGMIKSVARLYGSLRRTAEEFRAQVMESEELREPIDEIRSAFHGTRVELQKAQAMARRELQKARLEARLAEQRLVQLANESAEPRVSAAPPGAMGAALAAKAAASGHETRSGHDEHEGHEAHSGHDEHERHEAHSGHDEHEGHEAQSGHDDHQEPKGGALGAA